MSLRYPGFVIIKGEPISLSFVRQQPDPYLIKKNVELHFKGMIATKGIPIWLDDRLSFSLFILVADATWLLSLFAPDRLDLVQSSFRPLADG